MHAPFQMPGGSLGRDVVMMLGGGVRGMLLGGVGEGLVLVELGQG